MSDLTITAASVLPGSNASIEHGTAGATITQGQAVYKEAATKTYKLADSDSATAAAHDAVGIALNAASAGQPLAVQKGGQITIGATLTPGATYFVSNTAGGICPDADVGSGEEVVLLGAAISTTVLDLDINATGVTR